MDFNATIDLIIRDLEEARIIIDDLKQYPGVPAIQVELAKSKCKSAADVISLLREKEKAMSPEAPRSEKTVSGDPAIHFISQLPGQVKQAMTETAKPEPAHITSKPAEPAKPAESVQSAEPAVNGATGKNATEAIYAVPSGSGNKAVSQAENRQDGSKTAESSILAEQFSNLSPRINEQLGTARKEDVSVLGKPVSNLSEAIGINDRFLFIREIFNGDSGAFSRALSKLENASGIDDAKAILMSYTGNNQENEASRQLLDLVKRKFSHNG